MSLPNDADDVALNTGPMLKGLRDALQRINEELEFVQSLRVAREKIDDIERKLIHGLSIIVPLSNKQCLFRYLTPFLKSKKTPFPILHRRNCYKANRT